eukprot:13427197-Alexandrium_andersonii.AAC.1
MQASGSGDSGLAPQEALRYVNIGQTEFIDGAECDGDRTDRTEYLPGGAWGREPRPPVKSGGL